LCLASIFEAERDAHHIAVLSSQLLNDEPKALMQCAPRFIKSLLASGVAQSTVLQLLIRFLRGPCADWMKPEAHINREIGQALRAACVVSSAPCLCLCLAAFKCLVLYRNMHGIKGCVLQLCISSVKRC
jgi:hypothetical protein